MIAALVWKQWMEQRWALGLGCFMLVGFTAIALQARVVEDAIVLQAVLMLGVLGLPVLVAMGLVAPERAAGTLATVQMLPASPTLVYFIKSVMGALVVAVPLLLSAQVGLLIAGDRELPREHILALFHNALPVAIMLMVWTTTLAIRQPSEARVGVIGLAVVIAAAILSVALARVFGVAWHWTHHLVPARLVALHADGTWNLTLHGYSIAQLAIAGVVWAIGAWQFRQPARTRT